MGDDAHPAEVESPTTQVEASPQEVMPEVIPDPELIDRVALGRHPGGTARSAKPADPDDL